MAYPGAGEFLADMNYQQHQGMLSMLAGAGRGGAPDALAGGLMSRAGAIGQPLMSGAMGMLGLDPMSLGLKAGQMAWGSGAGVLGAGLAGAGVMGGAAIVGAGAHFVGSQMYQGAQQQLGLNQGLRNNFNFMNAQGGMGFTSAQGYNIGSSIRGMSENFGPGGEVATFGELSKLATNMGRMGMGQNVRSVAEFKDKFKEMVTTLKTIAHDMGSSLEEAQKFMESMRGSGIFRTADQLKMSAGTRLSALGGGLAMSEVTGMANIGSQISRSVGGLGRQGAFAGMKTIEQIGIAQRVGAINDEDVYNATGLTGAEGRQALATSQLQQSARFLSGGRGRRFLASISGKDGQLNQDAVMEYMMGGNVSTSRTMEMAHENLEGVGRANFIRNEGRLRGAAMEKFGGLTQSLVYKQWLSTRGYDPTSMDDKSMLAFQRFSGMGRDEADVAMRQVQHLPEMMSEMRNAKSDMNYSDELNKYGKSVGIEGMQRQFSQVRERIQGKFQQAGADIMEQGSDMLAQWFNRTMGVYEKRQVEGVDRVMRMARDGHTGAGDEMRRIMAGSNQIMPGASRLGNIGELGNVGGGGLSSALRMGSAMSAVEGAGPTAGATAFMSDPNLKSAFRRDFAGQFSGMSGLDRADAIMKFVGDRGGKDLARQYAAADANGKLRLAAGIEQAGGFGGGSGIGKTLTAESMRINDSGQSGWRRALGIGTKKGETVSSVDNMIGGSMMGLDESEESRARGDLGQSLAAGALAGVTGGLSILADAGSKFSRFFGKHADDTGVGAYMMSEAGQSMVAGVFAGKGDQFDAMQNKLAELNTAQASGKELDRDQRSQLTAIKNAQAAKGLIEDLNKTGKNVADLSPQDRERLAKQASQVMGREVSFDDLLKSAQGVKGALDLHRDAAVRGMTDRSASDIKGMREDMVQGGMASVGKDGNLVIASGREADILKAGGKEGGQAALEAYNIGLSIANTKYDGTTDQNADKLDKVAGQYAGMQQRIAGASLSQKRALARAYGGADPLGQLYATSAAREERFNSQIKNTKGGVGRAEAAVAGLLGVGVDEDTRKALATGDSDAAASLIMAKQGVTSAMDTTGSYRKQISSALAAGRLGQNGIAADALSSAESGASDAVKKQLEKFRMDKMGPAEQSATHLKNIAEGTEKMIAKLGAIADNTNKDKTTGNPEGTPAGPPSPTK